MVGIVITLIVVALLVGGAYFYLSGQAPEVPKKYTEPEPEPVAGLEPDKDAEEGKALIWTAEGRENKVYFLGSVHLLREEDHPLPQAMEEVYNASQKIVFETDIGAMEDPAFVSQIVEKMFYPPGETLSQNVSETTLKKLEKVLYPHQVSVAEFEMFKPWVISLALAELEFERLGYDPDLGVDKYFYEKAKSDGKEINYLEAPEYQINLMAGLDENLQELLLQQTLAELDIAELIISDMLEAWKAGDVNKVEELVMLGFEESPEISDLFLVQRNKEWVPLVEEFLKEEKNVLVIVGTAHLVGENNLIDLLKERGHIIK